MAALRVAPIFAFLVEHWGSYSESVRSSSTVVLQGWFQLIQGDSLGNGPASMGEVLSSA